MFILDVLDGLISALIFSTFTRMEACYVYVKEVRKLCYSLPIENCYFLLFVFPLGKNLIIIQNAAAIAVS